MFLIPVKRGVFGDEMLQIYTPLRCETNTISYQGVEFSAQTVLSMSHEKPEVVVIKGSK